MEIFEIQNPEIMSYKDKFEKYKEIIEDTEDFLLESQIKKSKIKIKKLKEFQKFIKDMNQIWLKLSNQIILDQKHRLEIKSQIKKDRFYTNIYLYKNSTLEFAYHWESKDFYTKDGKQSILFAIIQFQSKQASYVWTYDQVWLFDWYNILANAKISRKQIISIISQTKI